MRVLIVDDKREELQLLDAILRKGGYEVTSAMNGEEALQKLRTERINMVISDILMPVMDGFQLCQRVRKDERMKTLPFVFCTATYLDERDEALAIKMGADRFLRKPVEPGDFLAVIREVFEEAKERREREMVVEEESEVLQLYNERLVTKLEKKVFELERLTSRFQLIWENTNDFIFSLDEDGVLIDANGRAEMFGYRPEEMIGQPLSGYLAAESKERVLDHVTVTKKGESRHDSYEAKVIRKDGMLADVELSLFSLYRDGKFLGRFGIAKDITERKRMEDELRQREASYREIVEYSQAMLCTHDLEGKILSANERAAKSLGIDREKLPGMNLGDILAPEVKQELAAYLATIRQEGSAHGLMLVRTASGEKRIWEYFNTLRKEEAKRPIVIGTAFDVTEEKRTEEALRVSEQRFRQFFENAPIYCYMVSTEGLILDVNRTALAALGYEKEELVGKPVATIYSPEYRRKAEENLEIWKKGGRLREVEMELLTKRGERRVVLLSADTVRGKNGKVLHSISVQQDITERRRLEAQLQQAQKMEAVGRLAGGVAHDFNNVLTVIKAHSQLMLLDLRKGDPFREALEEIDKAADQAASLTRQLLAFSRRQVMEFRILDLNEVVRGMEKMLRRVLGEDIEFIAHYAEHLGSVKADPGQMEQVLMNLVVNARDAMPHGGKLTLETANVELDEEYAGSHVGGKAGSYVMLSVADTGAGMSPEVKERIFEPFFTTKEKGRGTGLGLSTVYGIVKQSGGNIWVYSEEGKGTTFKVYLPRVEEAVEEVRKPEEIREIPRGREVVLVVEDDETVRKLAVSILKRFGYRVLEAALPGEALLLCETRQERVDLVLTDVVMPQMSGKELVERMKRRHPEMKVLYMSGYTDNAIVHHGVLEAGLNFLQKPFTVEGLSKKVREVLDKEA